MKIIKTYYEKNPLTFIVLVGFLVRLIAVFFSKGYGMHDDHFLVIEAGQSIAAGYDYNNWLPWNAGGQVSGHSWFYVGFHILLFKFFQVVNVNDPQVKMLLIRCIHACYSLLVIILGYKITLRLSNEKVAKEAGWILALLWFIPSLSVRNLVEWVCVPPLLASSLALIKFDETKNSKYAVWVGLFIGIAMGIRYQCLFFFVGVGLVFLIRKEFINGVICFAVFFTTFFITQSADMFLWGLPFVELKEYVNYNFANSTSYFNRPSYQYIFTVGGMLIPPISLYLIAGYFKSWKKIFVLFLPSLCFFIFHSYFPNKQERFIMPFVPYLICGGIVGWAQIREHIKWKKFEVGSWKFFWIINILPLLFISTMYSKRSRVEAMYYLYNKPDYNNFIIESSHTDDAQLLPQYYSGKWQKGYSIYSGFTVDSLKVALQRNNKEQFPNYILFFEDQDLQKRTTNFQIKSGKNIELVYTAEPSFMDNLLHWLNKNNKNQPVFVYKVKS